MDPITATTTIITLATFIKDLIEVGQSIRESIEKVSENRRRLRELVNDILRSLADIANLTRGHDDEYMAPALLAALGDLKADLLHVLDICLEMQPRKKAASSKFRGFGSQVKMWMKRDKMESEIRRLREHVMSCYIKFTAFSTARIEQKVESAAGASVESTLRLEHRAVVHHAENQGRLRHIEGMMARVLLEERYGQDVMKRTVEIISSDPTHTTLEFQYLSVQTMHLVNSLEQLFISGRLDLVQNGVNLPRMRYPVFAQPTTPAHILHRVLGMVLQIHNSDTNQGSTTLPFRIRDFDRNIKTDLSELGLRSEAIAWSNLAVQMLKHLVACGGSAQKILPRISLFQYGTVVNYQHQLRYELALQASEEALLDWQTFPESTNIHWQMWGANLKATHARNLNLSKRSVEAVSLAQLAVSLSRPLVAQLAASGAPVNTGTPEEYTIFTSSNASFFLGEILSSLNRHVEAYKVLTNGFEMLLQFSGSIRPPDGEHIDTFIHQICTLAEAGDFNLQMLRDCVLLIRSLAHRYRESFAPQFFYLICAYICLNPTDSDMSMKDLRKFLEPSDGLLLQPPSFNTRRIHHVVDELHSYGEQFVEDVIRIYYLNESLPPAGVHTLVIYALNFHFDTSITILRDVVSALLMDLQLNSISDGGLYWALNDIQNKLIPAVPPKNRLPLMELADSIIAHFRRTSESVLPFGRDRFSGLVAISSWSFLSAGLLDGALTRVDEAIERRCSKLKKDDAEASDQLLEIQLRRSFILYDTGRLLDAIQAVQIHWTAPTGVTRKLGVLWFHWLQARILRCMAKYGKASAILATIISDAQKEPKFEGLLDLWFPTALAELAAVRNQLGQSQKTLEQVEQALVVGRQRDAARPTVQTKYSLIRYLLILADCLARTGRDEEALATAEEATSTYIENESLMWRKFLYIPRARQDLGAECFYLLSLRLATSEKLEAALEQAEKATELYREIASLAPVESPSLARSLRHHGSILQRLGRRDEGIAAYEEAADILRGVSKAETPFLLELEEVLNDLLECKTERAATIKTELEEVQRTIQVSETEPDFVFFDFVGHFVEEEEEGDEEYQTATEDSDDEYEDVIDTI
ncbi:hypothetical protein FB45DRAFT_1051243 [Roridomyces roridus]|uniref:Uncharacterized protein n=1 Tax=Roridomyces roridus TaxID=1738132 RepID=A0AAD7FVW8_9AGAR|nr:hypothetical protein FB45DRAFT_1051243 [Roridomyces roridus]